MRQGTKIAECFLKYQVPESTIRAKLQNKYNDKKPGSNTVLSAEEDKNLETWILWRFDSGLPVTRNQLLDSVKTICDVD